MFNLEENNVFEVLNIWQTVFSNDTIKTEMHNFYFHPKEINTNVISNTQKKIFCLGRNWKFYVYNKRMYKRNSLFVSWMFSILHFSVASLFMILS
jgi:hypothetical protein